MNLRKVEGKFRTFGSPMTKAGMISSLPKKQAQAVVCRFIFGQKFRHIAEKMHCPFNTAKANYRHGMTRLYFEMEKIEGIIS